MSYFSNTAECPFSSFCDCGSVCQGAPPPKPESHPADDEQPGEHP